MKDTARKKRGRYGVRLHEGQKWSGKYNGLIDCGNGNFREPYVWRGRSVNRYYIETTCSQCAAPMLKDRANARKSGNLGNNFCKPECRIAFINAKCVGKTFRKKRPHGDGEHILVRTHDHPRRGRSNLVYEHVIVVEKKLGRFLDKDERVHHINCVKDDNRPENLFVCFDNTEHFKIHGSLNRCVAQLLEMGVLRFDSETKSYVVVQP